MLGTLGSISPQLYHLGCALSLALGHLLVLPLLQANRKLYAPVAAQFAGRRMKSERNPAWSIDKIGWEIYIAVCSSRSAMAPGVAMERRTNGGGGVTMSDFSIGLSASARTDADSVVCSGGDY